MTSPDFSSFKETQQNAWKLVFQRLDNLESEIQSLSLRITKIEENLIGG
ncbi:MAG: hypothetical protein ACFFDT_04895 [Candidatus Hodarchaeota archaeon]